MELEHQEDILKFFAQNKKAKKFIPLVDESLFDQPEHQQVLALLQSYLKDYSNLPSRGGMLEYWRKQASKLKSLSKEVNQAMEKAIREAYVEFTGDTNQLEEDLIEHAQYRRSKEMVRTYGPKLKEGPETFKRMLKEMHEINQMTKDSLGKQERKPLFLLADHLKFKHIVPEGNPSFLKGLNKMTSARGFHTPQLIILLAGPKMFKTGFLINFAGEWVRDGLKGVYADFENGADELNARFNQQIIGVDMQEMKEDDVKKKLSHMIKRRQKMGGDIIVKKFQANVSTVADVDMWLDELENDYNFIPDFIIWDYPDLIAPSNKFLRETRHQISSVYHEIINLHDRRQMFGMGVSPANRQALGKPVLEVKDLGEDLKKAFNAHAVFALCATEEEEAASIRRVIPVVQRQGVGYKGRNTCVVKLDEARMQITECSFEEANDWLDRLKSAAESERGKSRYAQKKDRTEKPDKKSLTDD